MDNLETILSREYWITQKGEKVYAHEFEDEHLANTIRYLHRATKKYRLESARNLCEMVQRTGYYGIDIDRYYRDNRKQMDNCLGDLDDKQWLKENSKIYVLLVEEAKFREIDFSDKSTKAKYTGNVTSRYNFINKFSYIFNA